MLSLTRKSDYALLALSDLARNGRKIASARDLSERLGVPVRLLTNILNQLTHEGLVVSTRGTKGGYGLAKDPEAITLADLVEAVEGPIQLTRCCPTPEEPHVDVCDMMSSCHMRTPMHKVHQGLREYLAGITLSDMISGNGALSRHTGIGDSPHRPDVLSPDQSG